MLGFPLGILSAAGAGGGIPTPDYELISSTILGSTATDVTFANLGTHASTYKHLQIRTVVRGGKSVTNVPILVRINGITGVSYRWHFMFGNGSSVPSIGASSGDSSMYFGNMATGATSISGAFGAAVLDVLDPYSTTKNTTVRAMLGITSPNSIMLASGALYNTASVTSINIFPDSGGWVAGSRFSLYGIKG